MEKVENTAVVIMAARLLGRVKTLPVEEVRRLSAMRDEHLGPKQTFLGPDCERCHACEGLSGKDQAQASPRAREDVEEIVRLVTKQVLERLARQ